MAGIVNGESGLSARTKINKVLEGANADAEHIHNAEAVTVEDTATNFIHDNLEQILAELHDRNPDALATINIGEVTTVSPSTPAAVSNSGTQTASVLDFDIPKGDTGDNASVSIGTVVTGNSGTSVYVTNVGTPSDVILNFIIPAGHDGDSLHHISRIGGTGAAGTVSTYTMWGDALETIDLGNFELTQGDKGDKGDTGLTGERGLIGYNGPIGEDGPIGEQGEQGEQGIQGDQGLPGSRGLQGETGEQGLIGEDGEQGIQGDPGTGSGDMTVAMYDPTHQESDAFARNHHYGTIEASDVSDFQAAVATSIVVAANTAHQFDTGNPHEVTKEQVGLGSVTNDLQILATEKGVAGGVAELNINSVVPILQLPAFISLLVDYINTDNNLPDIGIITNGPLLQSLSSDATLIQYTKLDVASEFVASGGVGHSTVGGYQNSPCYNVTSTGSLKVFGSKTVDGIKSINGSIFYKADTPFNGTVVIKAVLYDINQNILTTVNRTLAILKDTWKRDNYILRIDEPKADTFQLYISIIGQTNGVLIIDNWSAYRVFANSSVSSDIPDIVIPTKPGVAVDRNGISGYGLDMVKNFEISAANGNAYLHGSLLVNGYVHTGNVYKSDNIETVNPAKVAYYSGCGINEYGVYGIKAELSGANHSSSKAKFLLAAKGINFSNDYYWGTGFEAGEFRVGEDVKKLSNTTLAGNYYFWVNATGIRSKMNGMHITPDETIIGDGNNTVLSNLSLTGNLILNSENSYIRIGGTATRNTGYISQNAIAFFGNDAKVKILMGTSQHTWLTSPGFRIGDNVQGSGTTLPDTITSPNLFAYDDGNMVLRINGHTVLDTSSSFAWSKITNDDGHQPDPDADVTANNAQNWGWISGSKPAIDADKTDYANSTIANDQQDWNDINTNMPSVISNTTGTYLGGTGTDWVHLGTNCYVDRTLYVGTSTNYIKMQGGSAPYMRSKSTSSGAGNYAWSLDYLGQAKFNAIEPVDGEYLWIGQYDGLFDYTRSVYQKNGTGQYSLVIGVSGTNGEAGCNFYAGSEAYISLYADYLISISGATTIELKPTTSGTLTLGGATTNYIGFYDSRTSQQQAGYTYATDWDDLNVLPYSSSERTNAQLTVDVYRMAVQFNALKTVLYNLGIISDNTMFT